MTLSKTRISDLELQEMLDHALRFAQTPRPELTRRAEIEPHSWPTELERPDMYRTSRRSVPRSIRSNYRNYQTTFQSWRPS